MDFLCQLTIEQWFSICSTSATLLMTYATWSMAKATKKMLDNQNKPYVVVYPRQREDAPQVIELVIENIGSGVAYDISFNFTDNLYLNAFGIKEEDATSINKLPKGAFITGIPCLPPRHLRKFNWGQFGGILKSLGKKSAEVTIFFKNSSGDQETPSKNILDISDFEGNSAYETLDTKKTNFLEKIEKSLSSLNSTVSKKMPSQSSEECYMWEYVACNLAKENSDARLELDATKNASGFTKEQLNAIEKRGDEILAEYRSSPSDN